MNVICFKRSELTSFNGKVVTMWVRAYSDDGSYSEDIPTDIVALTVSKDAIDTAIMAQVASVMSSRTKATILPTDIRLV